VEPQSPIEVEPAIAEGGSSTDGSSEFEGLATHALGRVFVLQERLARVLVLGPAMKVLVQTIKLEVASDHPDI